MRGCAANASNRLCIWNKKSENKANERRGCHRIEVTMMAWHQAVNTNYLFPSPVGRLCLKYVAQINQGKGWYELGISQNAVLCNP